MVSEVISIHLGTKGKDIFKVTNLRPGREYHIVRQDSCSKACALVYEPSPSLCSI